MKLLKVSAALFLAVCVCACVPQQNTKKTINLKVYEDFTAKEPVQEIIVEEDEGFVGVSSLNKKNSYEDAVVVVATRKIALGRTAGEKEMDIFTKSLGGAYTDALRMYRPQGFTYSMSPVGAINPLSDIEVSCVLSEQSAQDVGSQTCNLFFARAVENYAVNSALK